MKQEEIVNELTKRLLKCEVVSVDNGYGEACICRITTSHGNSFQIHANDLGVWIKDLKINEHGNFVFDTLRELIIEYNEYMYFSTTEKQASFRCFGGKVLFVDAPDGQRFQCKLDHEWEQRVAKSTYFFALLKHALSLGPSFAAVFLSPNAWSGCEECKDDLTIPAGY